MKEGGEGWGYGPGVTLESVPQRGLTRKVTYEERDKPGGCRREEHSFQVEGIARSKAPRLGRHGRLRKCGNRSRIHKEEGSR